MLSVVARLVTEHDLRLVLLSAVICMLGCYTTALVVRRMNASVGTRAGRLLAAAAAIFGCSVWSLHFAAMLGYRPGRGMSYDIPLLALSMLLATLLAAAALATRRTRIAAPARVAASGMLLGLAIVGMHYSGAAAMRTGGQLVLDQGYVIVSILAAVSFSTVAMLRSERMRTGRRCAEVAVWLSLGICTVHVCGMAAMQPVSGMEAGAMQPVPGQVLGSAALAMAVGGVSVVILVACVAAVMVEQLMSQRALQELDRMRLMSNLAQEVLLIHRDGVVLEVNSAGERLFKATAEKIIGQPLLSLFAEQSMPALLRCQHSPPHGHLPEEIELEAADGTGICVQLSCQQIDHLDKPATVMALLDLTERKRSEAYIRHMAYHDALTGLPNRHTLLKRLDLAIETTARQGGSLALVTLDLDRFKSVNDLYGHAAGDALLVQASRRITSALRSYDTLARIGGNEFVMIMTEGAQPANMLIAVTRVIEALRKPFTIEGHRIAISASAGIAIYPNDGGCTGMLMQAADAAMYRVKQEGRNGLRFHEASMNAVLQARLLLEQDLVGAVERNEFMLHYQPIVNGHTGEVETFEALIRWRHPQRGMIPPVDFIALAESAGLIDRIGCWIIDTACREAASWPHPWRVSINVSPRQFQTSDVCKAFEAAIHRNALDPARVVMEVTEGVLIDDARGAVATLGRLREKGIRVALDDFGTGYSSLSYLQMFRFDKFKIDRSFVNRLGQSADALTITRTIVNLGHNLGLQVTAEGVETVEQLDILRMLGCDQIQGYLIGRPSLVSDFGVADQVRTRSLFETPPASDRLKPAGFPDPYPSTNTPATGPGRMANGAPTHAGMPDPESNGNDQVPQPIGTKPAEAET